MLDYAGTQAHQIMRPQLKLKDFFLSWLMSVVVSTINLLREFWNNTYDWVRLQYYCILILEEEKGRCYKRTVIYWYCNQVVMVALFQSIWLAMVLSLTKTVKQFQKKLFEPWDLRILVRNGCFRINDTKLWLNNRSLSVTEQSMFQNDLLEALPPKKVLDRLLFGASFCSSSEFNTTWSAYVHKTVLLVKSNRLIFLSWLFLA